SIRCHGFGGECPERQRGRTVNPLAMPSQVRVLPLPPPRPLPVFHFACGQWQCRRSFWENRVLAKLYPSRVGALISWCFSELRSAKQRAAKFRIMVKDIGLLATARRSREALAFRLARAQHLTDRGQFAEAIAMLEQKVAARPRDPDLYFALG